MYRCTIEQLKDWKQSKYRKTLIISDGSRKRTIFKTVRKAGFLETCTKF